MARPTKMAAVRAKVLSLPDGPVTATAAQLNTAASTVAALTATTTQINRAAAAVGTVTYDRSPKMAKVALAALDTGGGVFAWANPEAVSILITRVLLDITTKATAACTVDVGTTATSATTSSDNLLDGVDVGTAAGLFGSINEAGTNGKSRQKLAAGKWVTGSMASGAAAGLVGSAYIEYYLA